VTEPGATAAAVKAFADRVLKAVETDLGVTLEREVIYI
jgi:UDP-N-acetylenolpyruvoylglucosamine reductase